MGRAFSRGSGPSDCHPLCCPPHLPLPQTGLLVTTLRGGWCQDRAEQGQGHGGWEGGHGEAMPVPRSQGQPGTSAGVTLPIRALSQDPGPGLAYQHSGVISRSCSRERLGRSELGTGPQGQCVLPANQLKAINPFRPGRRRAEAQECRGRGQASGRSGQPAAFGASGEEGEWEQVGRWSGVRPTISPVALGAPAPKGLWLTRVPEKVPRRFLLSEGRR